MPKKNLNKIPQNILSKISITKSRYFVAGCLKTYTKTDIKNGFLKHLSITIVDEQLNIPSEIIPNPSRGKYSRRNVNGYNIVRKNLPKVPYSITIESPNWGDSYKGTHDVTWTKEKYQKDYVAPLLSTIKIECLDSSPNLDKYTFKFEVSEVLDKESDDFKIRLLVCLNILQENIYTSDIVVAGSTFSDYLQTIRLSWEILPPGTKEETIERLFHGSNPSQQQIDSAGERYEFFMKLNPQKLVFGTSGFQRYFGALLKDDLVLFENIRYGNAIYIMRKNWEELSTKSRIELLSGRYGDNFDRVIHKSDWQNKVIDIIKNYLK